MKIVAVIALALYFAEFYLSSLFQGNWPQYNKVFAYVFLGAVALLLISYFFFKRIKWRHTIWLFSCLAVLLFFGWPKLADNLISYVWILSYQHAFENGVANAKFIDIHDEPLLSPQGNPIGIKVQLTRVGPSAYQTDPGGIETLELLYP